MTEEKKCRTPIFDALVNVRVIHNEFDKVLHLELNLPSSIEPGSLETPSFGIRVERANQTGRVVLITGRGCEVTKDDCVTYVKKELHIPEMDPQEVLRWSKRIRPLMETKDGLRIIKPFSDDEINRSCTACDGGVVYDGETPLGSCEECGGTGTFPAEVTDHPVFSSSFVWDAKPTDAPSADTRILNKVFTLHTFGYHGFFKPSIAEVIRQIPQDLLPVVSYFLVEGPDDVHDLNLQPDAFNAGFHRAKTTLYCVGDPIQHMIEITLNKENK